jgi:4-amino-4-deoxy-L-arabinose transferase-like glycosyltransferase
MRATSEHPSARSFGATEWLALALLAICALRIMALKFNATDLFFDEAQYWTWGQEPAFGYYSKPPLIGWISTVTSALCGDSTFCTRLPSPLIHTATAALVYLIGNRLHGKTVGIWAALTFATLPGISLSSAILSTDVPLLFAWALALWGLVSLSETDDWWPAVALAAGIGIGLNAKYAMAFFVVSVAIYTAITPSARKWLTDPRLWVGIGLGVAAILPNMAWNLSHSFATFAHTADNAKWGGGLLNIGKGFEFIASQFGVFGPIMFAALIATVIRAWREGLPESDRLLLAFTLPVLLLIIGQAFISRAHANWAAVAYVAGSILVPAVLLRQGSVGWLKASLAIHLAVIVLLSAGLAFAGRFTLPGTGDPFQRLVGWKAIADETETLLKAARAAGTPFRAVIADDRSVTAELLYYMRGETTPILAWRDGARPLDHYELTRPLTDPAQVPVLLVSTRRDTDHILSRFGRVAVAVEKRIPAGLGEPRTVRFISLSESKAR